MNKQELRKIGKLAYRFFSAFIFHCFIIASGFCVLNYTIKTMETSIELKIIITSTALAICYLQVANILYWIFDINLFDIKNMWGITK